MKLDPKRNLRTVVLVTISLFIISYIFYEARFVIYGPELVIFSPKDNLQVTSSVLDISGTAKNISMLSVNGRTIMITPDNLFTDKLLLLPGYNRIEIKAQNKFNQEKIEILNIVLNQTEDTSTTTTDFNR